MLSQVKRRLLHPVFLENAFLSPSVARFSSKKGPKEPFVSAQVSKSDRKNGEEDVLEEFFNRNLLPKKPRNKTSDEYSEVFDAVLDATFGKKTRKQVSSKAKPGQLNIQMAKAAHSVADLAGSKKTEVLGDIMDKLNSVFPGMDNHTKGKRQPSGKFKNQGPQRFATSFSDEDNVEDIVGMAVAQKGPRQRPKSEEGFSKRDRKNAVGEDTAVAADECDAVNMAFSGGGFNMLSSDVKVQPRFIGQRFTTVDQLLKSQKPLGIFTSNLSESSSLTLWKKFEEARLQGCTRFDPLNWFDQCIVWTEEGKLWHFPIDNEQGMDKEAEVDFSEHIFLDHHAEPWCPKEGPIKYFMELVLVGLSKNPYLTVQEKIETIDWYREYFMKNKPLLEEINVFGSSENPIDVEGKIS
ncbi:uncharacterized protein LOC117647520 [Thrips palmi]|uniref:Small ribosomal subunit protein mS31 n=1 Tax=Thrips palmi TaxID=161013 RepID=A0A6P8Z506_THRPL|nr:uncharacterized protein LOC117647520 [Thrips palmi]